MQHTKGEWELSKPNDGSIIMNGNIRAIVLPYSEIKGMQEEDRANAKLIAAAPELLDALNGLVYGHCATLSFDTKEAQIKYASILENAKIAIQKATV